MRHGWLGTEPAISRRQPPRPTDFGGRWRPHSTTRLRLLHRLQFEHPIPQPVAKADQYRSSRYRQSELRREQLKKQIRIEVGMRDMLEQSRARLDAARKARDLRIARLKSRKKSKPWVQDQTCKP
jgi:hypothetical protein